jgi:hypothetical protein
MHFSSRLCMLQTLWPQKPQIFLFLVLTSPQSGFAAIGKGGSRKHTVHPYFRILYDALKLARRRSTLGRSVVSMGSWRPKLLSSSTGADVKSVVFARLGQDSAHRCRCCSGRGRGQQNKCRIKGTDENVLRLREDHVPIQQAAEH